MTKTNNENLPTWRGAERAYAKAYRVLENMAQNGHVVTRRHRKHHYCVPSSEMTRLIDALDAGDEEVIKGLLLSDVYAIR